jgi:hypothetical protein
MRVVLAPPMKSVLVIPLPMRAALTCLVKQACSVAKKMERGERAAQAHRCPKKRAVTGLTTIATARSMISPRVLVKRARRHLVTTTPTKRPQGWGFVKRAR